MREELNLEFSASPPSPFSFSAITASNPSSCPYCTVVRRTLFLMTQTQASPSFCLSVHCHYVIASISQDGFAPSLLIAHRQVGYVGDNDILSVIVCCIAPSILQTGSCDLPPNRPRMSRKLSIAESESIQSRVESYQSTRGSAVFTLG
jgi:glutaredoxin